MSLRRLILGFLFSGVLGLAPISVLAQAAGAKGENFLYRVMLSDTLGELAGRFTSGWSNWTTLQTLNQVQDPFKLPVGLLLKIPFALIPELPASASVSYLAGQASVDGQPLSVSSQITEGQVVRTGPDGFVTLRLDDGSLLTIPALSSLTMKRLRIFKGTGLIDSIIVMQEGTLESQVAPGNTGVGRFEIRTPVSVTGVRGTHLRVHASMHGARSEVVSGMAGVDGARSPEVALRAKQGVAVNAAGQSLGVRDLLPAPVLPAPVRGSGGWVMSFPAVAGASAYLVRVATDPNGTKLVSRQLFSDAEVHFQAMRPGTHYVFVRAIDDAGIGGMDARQPFDGQRVLRASDGVPVLSGFGLPIAVAND